MRERAIFTACHARRRYEQRVAQGPYRSSARPSEPHRGSDREGIWLLVVLAVPMLVPLVRDLVSGADLGAGAAIWVLAVFAAARAAWCAARRRGRAGHIRERGRPS